MKQSVANKKIRCETKQLTLGLLFFIFFTVLIKVNLNAQISNQQITTAYLEKHLSKQSPKFILTSNRIRILKEKVKSDPLVKATYKNMLKEVENILAKPLISGKMNGFRLPAARIAMGNLGVLNTIYIINKDPRFLKRINEELISLCNFPNWNAEHFIDTGQMAMIVALTIDWVGADLPKETVALAKKSLIDKAILPSYNINGLRMENVIGTHHWSAVCNGGMIVASMAIADIDPGLAAKTINISLEKMSKSLAQYGPDGTHPEGILYWRFSTSFFVLTAQALQTALGSDFGILEAPGFVESATFRLLGTAPSGEMYNYADSDGNTDGETKVILAWFAAQTGDAMYLDSDFFKSGEGAGRNSGFGLIWLAQFKEKKHSKLPLEWVGKGGNPTAFFRVDSQNPKQFYLALKGSSPIIDHVDMDAGSFIFELNGVRWVLDPGNQDYTALDNAGFDVYKYCQDCERWDLLIKGNQGHSTLMVNNAKFNVTENAPIIGFNVDGSHSATVDMTAVLDGLVTSSIRTFIKESDESILIEDRIQINEKTKEITWSIMTVADVIPTPNGALLKQDGKELQLSILSPEDMEVSVILLDPAPLEIDKQIKNFKRIEIRVPAYYFKEKEGLIRVRLSGK